MLCKLKNKIIKIYAYLDSQNASKHHDYCYYDYNCYNDQLMMNNLAYHVQVQPKKITYHMRGENAK